MEEEKLRNLSRLQLRKNDGTLIYGYNQEWYGTEWQRMSGCGPTAATLLSDYVLQRDGYLQEGSRDTKAKRKASMEIIWKYVTPSHHGGLYKTKWFRDGLQRFLEERFPQTYQVEMLPIPAMHLGRHRQADIGAFIAAGLREDSPVAFLNLSRGKEKELQSWHWISIVWQKGVDPMHAFCYDNGAMTCFSPQSWQTESLLGGGLAYIRKLRR